MALTSASKAARANLSTFTNAEQYPDGLRLTFQGTSCAPESDDILTGIWTSTETCEDGPPVTIRWEVRASPPSISATMTNDDYGTAWEVSGSIDGNEIVLQHQAMQQYSGGTRPVTGKYVLSLESDSVPRLAGTLFYTAPGDSWSCSVEAVKAD